MDKQLGRPVLVEFWDFCRPNSLRTQPYVKAWHARYAAAGLRVQLQYNEIAESVFVELPRRRESGDACADNDDRHADDFGRARAHQSVAHAMAGSNAIIDESAFNTAFGLLS